MHKLMFHDQAGVKGMSERSELIPCNKKLMYNSGIFQIYTCMYVALYVGVPATSSLSVDTAIFLRSVDNSP